MTRSEFIEEITTFDELYGFCLDNNYEEIFFNNDICPRADVDYLLDDYIKNGGWESWKEVKNVLEDIPDTDWYIRDYWSGEYEEASNSDLDDLKEKVLEAGDEDEIWDPEDINVCESDLLDVLDAA